LRPIRGVTEGIFANQRGQKRKFGVCAGKRKALGTKATNRFGRFISGGGKGTRRRIPRKKRKSARQKGGRNWRNLGSMNRETICRLNLVGKEGGKLVDVQENVLVSNFHADEGGGDLGLKIRI